jgi:hypothetical protein
MLDMPQLPEEKSLEYTELEIRKLILLANETSGGRLCNKHRKIV